MPEAQIRPRNPSVLNPSLLAFKPRQVLLTLNQQSMKQRKASSTETLENGSRSSKFQYNALLVNSISLYLQRRGFSKTLKSFRSEANIKDEDLEDLSLDLEEICLKYLETCDAEKDSKRLRDDRVCKLEEKSKDKKKNKKVNNTDQINSEVTKASAVDGETSTVEPVPELKEKSKEKKKSRKIADSIGDETKRVSKATNDEVCEPTEKHKDKKKRKKKSDSGSFDYKVEHRQLTEEKSKDLVSPEDKSITEHETTINPKKNKKKKDRRGGDDTTTKNMPDASLGVNGNSQGKKKNGKSFVSESFSNGDAELSDNKIFDSKMDDIQNSEEGAAKEEKEGSKKRKWQDSEKTDCQPADGVIPEKSKRRKTKSHGDNGSEHHVQDTPETKLVTHGNGDRGNYGPEKSASQKSNKKQTNGSVEPKTVNAFQRVKADEVVFSDKRLQDNSYWAKDGAETGYGAKAQEILGQVRGRDFRHEKTKKKRGSYRGGQIDLHSHSVKFNYSDED